MPATAPLLSPRQARTAPAHAWAPCGPDELDAILAEGGWSLVEFWTPFSLYSRLLAPARLRLAATHATRLRLLCCTATVFDDRFVTFGATALPALLLFQGRRRIRRWLGVIDPSLLSLELDSALANANP